MELLGPNKPLPDNKTNQPKMDVHTSRVSFSASFSTLVKPHGIAPTYFSMKNPFPIDLLVFEQSICRISSNKFHSSK